MTMTTFLPPISVWYRIFLAAHAAATRLPTPVDPVKLTARTGSAARSALPTVPPAPSTTLNTPAGSPASAAVRARSVAVKDACSAGFSTTVFPNASAGAAFQMGMAAGKFQGVMSPTTPSGSRSVNWSIPSAWAGMTSPFARTASPA
jgi:hypothetical protein